MGLTLYREELLPPRFAFRDGPKSPYFQQSYVQIATDAAILLGKIPEGIKPVEHWLISLVEFCTTQRTEYVQTITEIDKSNSACRLHSICEASATYCAWLDVDAIEEESLGSDGVLDRIVKAVVAEHFHPVGITQPDEALQPVQHEIVPSSPTTQVKDRFEKTLSERLDDAASRKDISHEEQAHRIGISRSMYFEVKAGRGGKKVRAKVYLYLRSFESDK